MEKINFTNANRLHLISNTGQKYIDACSGTFNLALGYNHPKVIDAVTKQMQKFSHLSSNFETEERGQLLQALLKDAPEGIDRVWFRDITGSTANECAVKMAQKATGKNGIISFFGSHHGQTVYTTALSGNAFRRSGLPVAINSQDTIKVPAPYCYRCPYKLNPATCNTQCVEAINDFIDYASADNIAAVIIEPIMGNGGNIVPPAKVFKSLNKLAKERNIAIIADEVQTGIGRLGHKYGSEVLGLKPDIIALAKGLGGVGIPVAAVVMKSKFDNLKSFEHSFTSGANMISLVGALSTLNVLEEEKIYANVLNHEGLIESSLLKLKDKYKQVGDVRGKGYMWGIEINDLEGNVANKNTIDSIIETSFANQLIVRPSRYGFGNVIKVRPSLIANAEEIEEIMTKLDKTLSTTIS
ncbi:MAG: hypothetical protein QG673_152 [Pseudomonadota bacterium]|nr:hypothetical protein [Pseudomonadota bacterium]